VRIITERADWNCKNEEMSPWCGCLARLRVNSNSNDECVRCGVGVVSMEARVVCTGIGVLWDPGEGLAGHATERGGSEHAVVRDRTILKLGGKREDQRGIRVGGGAEGVGERKRCCNPWRSAGFEPIHSPKTGSEAEEGKCAEK
jgi:hypothetical protein